VDAPGPVTAKVEAFDLPRAKVLAHGVGRHLKGLGHVVDSQEPHVTDRAPAAQPRAPGAYVACRAPSAVLART
jgi:hypothetical protein